MSSVTGGHDLPRSMKNLWTLLSGSLNLKSLQFIADELEQSQHQLLQGIFGFKPHDAKRNSLEELSKKKWSGIRHNILYNLSVFLDLEADQCHQLFQSYLLYEYKGTPETVKSLFSSEKQMKEIFENLWSYYYSERIFTLFCFKQILSNWKTNEHIYHKIFQDFLKHINADNQLLTKLMDQLETLITFNLDFRSKYGPYFTEKFQAELRENILKEQSEILQLLLLYYKNFEPSIENVVELLKLFIENGFSTKSNYANGLSEFIGLLKSLLIVECFDPNFLYKCHLDGIEHFIFKPENAALIRDINSLILNMNTSVTEHSLIFMCWMIISVLENSESSEHVERLGSTAMELKIFRYLDRILQSSQLTDLKGSFTYNLVHEIIGNLLAVTFTTFDFDKLVQTDPSLSHLLIQLFAQDLIAKMVFESSLASGLGLSIRYSLDLFPSKTHFLLNMLHALSRTSSCKNLFESMSILNTLTTFTETFDSSIGDFTAIQADTIVLLADKTILPNSHIKILKGTKGTLFHFNGSRFVKWTDVALNGWKLVYYRLKFLTNQIKQGQMYASMLNDEVVLNEISTIAFLCSELIAHNAHHGISHFKAIVHLLLETFKLLVNLNHTSIRLFMAGIVHLAVNVMKSNYLPADQLWFILTEKNFFPYMIGFTNQFTEILAGTDTNISTLGYILSTDEFIKGNYELTFAFLNFVTHCVKREEFLDEKLIIASLIFVLKDIFPSYKLWNYKHEQDAHRIGHMCVDIFYQILNRARKRCADHELMQIEKICTVALMEGNAAEYLLHIIKNGEETVKRKIFCSGNDSLLVHDEQIVTVRTSLLALSYLLELYSRVGTVSSSKKSKSVIEELLFSSTNNANPNMLLMFTYFVYQKYDIFLATNAMQLLSQLAFKFPMSMLACFGSSTESIRDHFLFRLETVTEDINFKISLLNFLSICVEHQPGLVEMFLNVGNDQGGVLNSVIEILEEKLEGLYFCPFELHQATLQFVAKFWLRPNMIAINLLKKNDKFWKLITFPLFAETTSFNNSLCSYILTILSREMFYTKMLDKDTSCKDLENVFAQMTKESVIEKLSTHIQKQIIEPQQIDDDSLALLNSWKDFLSSWTMFKQPDLVSAKITIALLENLSLLLENNGEGKYTKIINKFSNLLLLISANWKLTTIELLKKDDLTENVIQLYSNVIQNKDVISFNALVSLNTFLLKILLFLPELNQPRLFHHLCLLLNNSIQLISKQLASSSSPSTSSLPSSSSSSAAGKAGASLSLEKKLISVHLFIVISMLRNATTRDYGKYLDMLRTFEISELIFNLLIYLINQNVHLDLAQNLPLYFVAVSSHADGAEFLHNQNIINNIAVYLRLPTHTFEPSPPLSSTTASSSSSSSSTSTSSASSISSELESSYIGHIFALLVRTVISMTIHLRHHFVECCISFVAIYCDSFRELCRTLRQTRRLQHARLVLLTFELCSALSKYISVWQLSHPISLRCMTEEILLTSNSVIAFVLRPTLLIHSHEQTLPGQQVAAGSSSPFVIGTQSLSLPPAINIGGSSSSRELPISSHNLLLQILLHSFKFIFDISPNLFDLFEEENANPEKYHLHLSTNFSLPNIDSREVLTFGSLVNFINFAIKSVYKLDRESPSSAKTTSKSRLNIDLLEFALTILLNQTLIAKKSNKINQMDKQLFFREISNEMNTINSNLASKQQRRQNSISTLTTPVTARIHTSSISSTGSGSGGGVNINLMHRPYIQLLIKLMDNVIPAQ